MLIKYELLEGKVTESTNDEANILLFFGPDENEKKFLIEKLQVDEHTLNSSLDPDELSRIEFEPDHIAVIFKRPKNYSGKEQLLFRVASAGLFLFSDKLIMVVPEQIQLFDRKQFSKCCTLKDVMLKMIYRSIFHYLEHLKVINEISDELEKKINASMDNRYIINLFSLEKSLVYYLNSINSNGVLIEKLKNYASRISFTQDEVDFLDDMLIENTQCYKQAEIYSNILASLMDARASVVGNNLNVLMKTLTIITIGIMVPTFVVSAFSMNVSIPFEDHPYAFYIVLGFALSSILILRSWLKKKHW
ncbi:MAG: magnesium transporter CorA family protein [Ignavibacteriae bacterium]|nr:MAG: magnesium transporter CorA family protein [Ignavibacteriota bacterium]